MRPRYLHVRFLKSPFEGGFRGMFVLSAPTIYNDGEKHAVRWSL